MDTTTLREQALAAWEQRQQEITVNAERQRAERAVRLIDGGTRAVLRALSDDGRVPVGDLNALATERRIGVLSHYIGETGFATATFAVDGIALRWIVDGDFGSGRLVLMAACPDCGNDVEFSHNIIDLYGLGQALADQRENPKMMHTCPRPEDEEPEPEWEGNMTLAVAMAKTDDPALVLLDALQGYIHAAVTAAVDARTLTAEEAF